jgi:hypothetical protein
VEGDTYIPAGGAPEREKVAIAMAHLSIAPTATTPREDGRKRKKEEGEKSNLVQKKL